MTQPTKLDPYASPLAFFGSEVRRYRNQLGLSQDQLGELLGYTGDLVGMIEKARRNPSKPFAQHCDEVFKTDGFFLRMWPLIGRVPSWFREYVDVEATATSIQTFEPQLIPGLFQTEAYMRALFAPLWSDESEAHIATRLDRQALLGRLSPPLVWAVIDESVLRRPVGGTDVMRAQLKRLVDLASPRIVVQVLPYAVGAHSCMDGPMTILSHDEGPQLVYFEGSGIGQVLSQPSEVARSQHRYDLARAVALAPAASVELIRTVAEELKS